MNTMNTPKKPIDTATIVTAKPTIADPSGCYTVIIDGKYYGNYYVGEAWTGEKFVAPATSYDGLPR